VTLKSRLGVIAGHWKSHHSIDCMRVPIHLPLQLWPYLVQCFIHDTGSFHFLN